MDISARKMALIQWLLDLKDVNMITHLENLSTGPESNALGLSQSEVRGLDHALAQVENGETIRGEDVHARLKAKYNL